MSATCGQMSCRFDTLADMQCRRVGNMTEDMLPTRHTMSTKEGLGRQDTKNHSLKVWPNPTTRHVLGQYHLAWLG
jgi:hypothetical protein